MTHPVCDKPDRDVPRMRCGYPLPCPWHTVLVEVKGEGEPAVITVPPDATGQTLAKLGHVALLGQILAAPVTARKRCGRCSERLPLRSCGLCKGCCEALSCWRHQRSARSGA